MGRGFRGLRALLEWFPWLLSLVLFFALIIALMKLRGLREVFDAELSRRVAEIELRLSQEVTAKLDAERERLAKMYEQRFEEWKQKEMEGAVKVELEKWRQNMEKKIRQDAIRSSITTLLGKVSEHIAPLYMVKELGVDPRDLRFIGTPVDYIAFKGLSDGNPEKILFIEVKASQAGALTGKERNVKSLVESRKVEWVTFNIRREVEKAFEMMEKEVDAAAIQPQVGAVVEVPSQPIIGPESGDEFYKWLASEFEITREEYEGLEEEVKKMLREQYELSRAR